MLVSIQRPLGYEPNTLPLRQSAGARFRVSPISTTSAYLKTLLSTSPTHQHVLIPCHMHSRYSTTLIRHLISSFEHVNTFNKEDPVACAQLCTLLTTIAVQKLASMQCNPENMLNMSVQHIPLPMNSNVVKPDQWYLCTVH